MQDALSLSGSDGATIIVADERRALAGLRRQTMARFLLFGFLLSALAAAAFYGLGLIQMDRMLLTAANSQVRHLANMISSEGMPGRGREWTGALGDLAFVRLEWRGRTDEIWNEGVTPEVRSLAKAALVQHSHSGHWDQDIRVGGAVYRLLAARVDDGRLPLDRFVALYRIDSDMTAWMHRQLVMIVIGVMAAVIGATSSLLPVIGRLESGVIRNATEAIVADVDILKALGSAVAKRDNDTDIHNYRVTVYAVRLGEMLRLSGKQIRGLVCGAFLHDVGKIGIPDHILLKPGRLTPDEFEIMKQHVTHGLDIVSVSRWLEPAAEVVGSHHERFDGTGYPQGLQGEQIPLSARIFAVGDVFDAVTSKRPYKEAISVAEALNILREGRGNHFDPHIIDVFLPIAEAIYRQVNDTSDCAKMILDNIIEMYFLS